MELEDGIGWRRPFAVLAVVILVAGGAMVFMGTQVSHILSTVGSSVNSQGGGIVGSGVGQGQVGGGDADNGGDPGGDGGGSSSGVTPGSAVASLLGVGRPELLIIKTGSIAVQAADLDAALADASARMMQLGGYASASERSGDGDDARASTTYRIPAARWDEALTAARSLGEKILDERSETADVTGQVVDLEARIRNLETTEGALQEIMDRATDIKDVLNVQAELTTVRGAIEQLASRSADLQEQAAMSTLTLTISVKPAPVVAQQEARFSPGTEAEAATAQLVAILQALATAGIWFSIVWLPILLALTIVGGIGVLIVRRVRRGSGGGGSSIATAPGGSP